MKIALITAVFGGTDIEKPFCAQSMPDGIEVERFFFCEANTPIPLPNLPPRLQAKYFKTQSHHIPILQGYDVHIWIDGNIEVTHNLFARTLIAPLLSEKYAKVSIQAHHHRNTIQEEIAFITSSMGNPYLNVRYQSQPLQAEYDHYIQCGMPTTAPLYSCNVFARKIGAVSNTMFDEWWRMCVEWSWYDQTAFTYLAWQSQGVVCTVDMGGVVTSPYYTLHGHDDWER